MKPSIWEPGLSYEWPKLSKETLHSNPIYEATQTEKYLSRKNRKNVVHNPFLHQNLQSIIEVNIRSGERVAEERDF